MKSITFLLPSVAYTPIGGYKVVYEYANRLVNDGYDVRVVYSAYSKRYNVSWFINALRFVKALLRLIRCRLTGYRVLWFDLDARVKEITALRLSESFVPSSDVYVATSLSTAISLKEFKSNSRKIYMIQGYEAWGGLSEQMVISSYQFGFKNVVISKWLDRVVRKYDSECVLIPNGFDFNFFKRSVDYADRNRYCVAMLYHTQELKGCEDGFKALSLVKERYPELRVNIFGVAPRPQWLPEWYCYYQQPDRDSFNKLYNEASIFVGTSWSEGWGLTVGEAMICGCAIACTDNDGYKEMVDHEVTALISPIKSPQQLADNVIRLISDDTLRVELARRGGEHIKNFNWDSSYKKFKDVIG